MDKAPRVSPYRLSVHAGFAYTLYTIVLWNTMTLLRRPQESVINTLPKVAANNAYRNTIVKTTKFILPIVLLTGFFTAGTNAGMSCNTFPKVGPNWFYNKNHFFADIPMWQNFVENKLVCQVNHRTIASIVTFMISYKAYYLLRLKGLTLSHRRALFFLVIALWCQMGLGITTIWNSVPINLASSH